MSDDVPSPGDLGTGPRFEVPAGGADEVALLRERLREVEEALLAVRAGRVDALVVGGLGDERVAVFSGALLPYRVMVESLGEGAATLSRDGAFLFANRQLATLLGAGVDVLVGRDVMTYVDADDREHVSTLLSVGEGETRRAELRLVTARGEATVLIAVTALSVDGLALVCCVITDITSQRRLESYVAQEMRLAEQRAERLRVAHDLNDTIVQHLVTAEMAFDLDDVERARELVTTTSRQARALIGELVGGRLVPGMAVRDVAVTHHEDRA